MEVKTQWLRSAWLETTKKEKNVKRIYERRNKAGGKPSPPPLGSKTFQINPGWFT